MTVEIEGSRQIPEIYGQQKASFMLSGETMEAFSLDTGARQDVHCHQLSNIVLDVLVNAFGQEEGISGVKTGKEEL